MPALPEKQEKKGRKKLYIVVLTQLLTEISVKNLLLNLCYISVVPMCLCLDVY